MQALNSAISEPVEMYQREVVALIRDSGARVSLLRDYRLAELWREYSWRRYGVGWVLAEREEVYRFVTWSNSRKGLPSEINTRARELSLERLLVRRRVAMMREVRPVPRHG